MWHNCVPLRCTDGGDYGTVNISKSKIMYYSKRLYPFDTDRKVIETSNFVDQSVTFMFILSKISKVINSMLIENRQ